MSERLVTFLVWTLVGGTAGVLALRLWPQPAAPAVPLVATERLGAPSLERLLGSSGPVLQAAQPQAAPADARFQLLGVVAARAGDQQDRTGLALLVVDGGMPRSVRVGQMVDGELQLLRVEPTGVFLGRQGVVQVQLRLDPPAAAATGNLPSLSLAPAAPPAAPFAPPPQAQSDAPPSGPMPAAGDGLPRRRNPLEAAR